MEKESESKLKALCGEATGRYLDAIIVGKAETARQNCVEEAPGKASSNEQSRHDDICVQATNSEGKQCERRSERA